MTCVYLFHELPAEARRAAAAEMARVLAPGGMLVLTDSVQLGDREAFDPTLGNFENFNEPYYGAHSGASSCTRRVILCRCLLILLQFHHLFRYHGDVY